MSTSTLASVPVLRRMLLAIGLLVSALPTLSEARPVRKPVAYELEGKKFEGVLLFDDAVKTTRPGLLLVPNWLGINEANLSQAAEVAGKDYVIFVADLYGTEVRPKNPEEARKAAGEVRGNRPLMRARTQRALEAFLSSAKEAPVDAKRIGAIGFCFGGTAVIELARSGAAVAGVVSFHGGLDAVLPAEEKIRSSVLALHGADDPTVSAADLQAFKEDMRKRGGDWVLVEFGGAVHSFTDRHANTPGRNMYDAKTSARAFEMMHDFFRRTFAG